MLSSSWQWDWQHDDMILDECWQYLGIWLHLKLREFNSQQQILAKSWTKVDSTLTPSWTIVGYMWVNCAKLAGSWTKVGSSLAQNIYKLCQDSTNLAWFTTIQPTIIQLGVKVESILVQDAANFGPRELNSQITKYRQMPRQHQHLSNASSTCCQHLGELHMPTYLQCTSKMQPTYLCPKQYLF